MPKRPPRPHRTESEILPGGGILLRKNNLSPLDWFIASIHDAWEERLHKIVECGMLLRQAKGELVSEYPSLVSLPHGEFEKMIEERLPFGPRTAQKLMRIARHPYIEKATLESVLYHDRDVGLPASVETLYMLSGLDHRTVKKAIAAKKIHPDMTREEAGALVDQTKRYTRLKTAAEQNVPTDTSLWLADPPWRASYELPYPTMTLEAIRAFRMGPDGNATTDLRYPTVAEASAKHAAIGLWAIDELLHEAEDILAAWGFTMLGRIIWNKVHHVRPSRACIMQHEFLLIGVKGDAVPVWRPASVISLPRGKLENSQKPVEFHAILQKMFPFFNERMELFARRTAPAGWRGWGNQYPGDAPAVSEAAMAVKSGATITLRSNSVLRTATRRRTKAVA